MTEVESLHPSGRTDEGRQRRSAAGPTRPLIVRRAEPPGASPERTDLVQHLAVAGQSLTALRDH